MRRTAPIVAVMAAALAMLASAPPETPPDPRPPGVHALEYEAHRHDPPFPPGPPLADEVVAAARAWEQTRPHRSRSEIEVIGYLPYWMGDGAVGLRYDVLTVVNYFAAHVEPDGELSNLNGWGNEATEQLVTQAHAAGCKVALTVANFEDDELHDLLSSSSHRATAIEQLLDQVLAMNADGVDVDFEGMNNEDKPHLTSFMQEMQVEFEAAMPAPWLTLATPAVDWSGAYDYDELMVASNGCFFMGYGYHWSGGDPGPLAPKAGSTTWGTYSLSWSIEDYIEWGGEDNRHGVYMGLPLYGRDWPSVDDSIPGEATDVSDAITYVSTLTGAATHGEQWDADSTTPYYMFTDGGWHQVWYDHADSLLSKIELVADYDIGGFGFWALHYDDNDPELWDGIAALVGDDDDDDDDDDATDDDDDDDDVTDDDDDDTTHVDPGALPPPRFNTQPDAGCECPAAPDPSAGAAALLPGLIGWLGLRRRGPA